MVVGEKVSKKNTLYQKVSKTMKGETKMSAINVMCVHAAALVGLEEDDASRPL